MDAGGGDPRAAISRRSISSRRRRPGQPAHPEPGALAGIGDQADDPFARIHRRTQRVAARASANHPPAPVHREALLPAGLGRRLARVLHRRPHQRLSRPRAEVSTTRNWSAITCAWASIRTAPGGFTNCGPDFHPADKVQVEDDITASVVLPRDSLTQPRSGVSESAASSWCRIARRCCSSVPTTPSIAASMRRRRPTSPRPAPSFRTSSR